MIVGKKILYSKECAGSTPALGIFSFLFFLYTNKNSNRVRVISIEWLSKEATEAILEVSDGEHTCFVFCHPCSRQAGDQITTPLRAFLAECIQITSEAVGILRIRDTLSHQVICTVVSVSPALVSVGNIKLEIDEALPGDIVAGDAITFVCSRIDTR